MWTTEGLDIDSVLWKLRRRTFLVHQFFPKRIFIDCTLGKLESKPNNGNRLLTDLTVSLHGSWSENVA